MRNKALEDAIDPRTKPVEMTFDEARARISNHVYAATELFERLEGAGLVYGNGHHMRQEIAQAATKLLEEHWKGPKE